MRGFGQRRLLTHAVLAGLCPAAVWLAQQYAPRAEAAYVFSLAFGYCSVVLIGVTLLIGPFNLLRRRGQRRGRNPVNLFLRRDVGIWAGITGCLHVIFALRLHMQGQALLYFLQQMPDGSLRPLLNRFGISNDTGLVALVLLVLLLITSNTLSIRILKGRRWKSIQRLNYVLAVLALIHTLAFSSAREPVFTDVMIALSGVVTGVQVLGMLRYQQLKRNTNRL